MAKKTKEYLISGDNFFPNTQAERATTLPPGAYEIGTTMEGAPYLTPINIVTDKIVNMKNSVTTQVVEEVRTFWSEGVSAKFEAYGLVHKRGVILAGAPGCGKTVTLAETAKLVIEEFQGVVLFNPAVNLLPTFLRIIKDIEPNKKVMIMWEEFDSIINQSETTLLSLLDGEIQVGNIIYLATTNYLSKIPARIKNRPSRFARIIEVQTPDEEMRRQFLSSKLHGDDVQHLNAMVQASNGFVIDQLKDLIISVCCFGFTISDAVMKINEMNDDSMGLDDYQEEQANKLFQTIKKERFADRPRFNPIK